METRGERVSKSSLYDVIQTKAELEKLAIEIDNLAAKAKDFLDHSDLLRDNAKTVNRTATYDPHDQINKS
ncbi:MAG: hypothetical protein AAF655_12595 [Bacteroidota bacterium]